MAQEYFLYGTLNKSIAKVQGDYDQADVFALDYIKNKPQINGVEISGNHPASYYGLVSKDDVANIAWNVRFFASWNDPTAILAVWNDPEASIVNWIVG